MKISQLDYSAMMNANSAVMAAEANAQNNRAISMADSINKMNQKNLDRTSELQAKAAEIQASANKTNAIANIINAGLNMASAGAGIYDSIRQAKIENDTTASNLATLQNVADFQTLIATADNLGSFNDQGEFVISDEITGFLDKVVSDIKGSDWTKEVKDMALQQWAEIGASASVSIAQEYGARQRESKATLETMQLDQIKKAEVISGTGYEAGYNFIDSLSYDDTTKEVMRQTYKQGVDSDRRKQTALSTLAASGYSAARAYVSDLSGITEEERNALYSSLSTQYTAQKTNAAQEAGNLMAELLGLNTTAADAREAVMQYLGAYSQDADFQQAIKQTIDAAQIGWATAQYPDYAKLDYLSPIEIDQLSEDISNDDKGVFVGIESTQEAMLANISSSKSSYTASIAQAEKDSITNLEGMYNNYLDATVSSYQAGLISSNEAIKQLQAYGNDLLAQFDAQFEAYALKDENGSYLLDADGQRRYTYEYQLFRDQLESRTAKAQTAKIKECTISMVPDQWKDYVAAKIDAAMYTRFNNKDKSKLDGAKRSQWEQLSWKYEQKVLDFVRANASHDITEKQWDDFFAQLDQEFTYKASGLVVDLAGGSKALVTEDSYGHKDYSNLTQIQSEAQDAEGAIYENINGGFSFTSPEWEEAYLQQNQFLTERLEQMGLYTPGKSEYVFNPDTDANGSLIPRPVAQVGGNLYKLAGFDLLRKEGDSWVLVSKSKKTEKIKEEAKAAGIHGTKDEGGIPYGSAGDSLRSLGILNRDHFHILSGIQSNNAKLQKEVPEDTKNRLENPSLWKLAKNTPKGT